MWNTTILQYLDTWTRLFMAIFKNIWYLTQINICIGLLLVKHIEEVRLKKLTIEYLVLTKRSYSILGIFCVNSGFNTYIFENSCQTHMGTPNYFAG